MSIVLSLLFQSLAAGAPGENAGISKLLEKKVPLFIITNDEFRSLCENERIPCGEEIDPNQNLIQSDEAGLRLEGKKIREILDVMARRRAGFEWRIENEVLVLRRQENHIANPLDQHVRRFTYSGLTLRDIIRILAGKTGMQLSTNQDFGHAGTASQLELERIESSAQFDIACDGMSARQILNEAVFRHGHAIWVFTYPLSQKTFLNIHKSGRLEWLVY
jgi:hypothetical protein